MGTDKAWLSMCLAEGGGGRTRSCRKGSQGLRGPRVGRSFYVNIKSPAITKRAINSAEKITVSHALKSSKDVSR